MWQGLFRCRQIARNIPVIGFFFFFFFFFDKVADKGSATLPKQVLTSIFLKKSFPRFSLYLSRFLNILGKFISQENLFVAAANLCKKIHVISNCNI